MASELLSSVTGGGGGSVSKFVSGMLTIGSGVSGDIITLTPPAGQRVKLTHLSASAPESGMTVQINAIDVLTSMQINTAQGYAVGSYTLGVVAGTSTLPSVTSPITGNVGEVLVIQKDTGNTGSTIRYMYSFEE